MNLRPGEMEYLEGLASFFGEPGVKVNLDQRIGFLRQDQINRGQACGCFGVWVAYRRGLGYLPDEDAPEPSKDPRGDDRAIYDMADGYTDFQCFVSRDTEKRLANIAGVNDLFGLAPWIVPPARALKTLIKEMKGENNEPRGA